MKRWRDRALPGPGYRIALARYLRLLFLAVVALCGYRGSGGSGDGVLKKPSSIDIDLHACDSDLLLLLLAFFIASFLFVFFLHSFLFPFWRCCKFHFSSSSSSLPFNRRRRLHQHRLLEIIFVLCWSRSFYVVYLPLACLPALMPPPHTCCLWRLSSLCLRISLHSMVVRCAWWR